MVEYSQDPSNSIAMLILGELAKTRAADLAEHDDTLLGMMKDNQIHWLAKLCPMSHKG